MPYIELEWNGEAYTATLTDTKGVLSDYAFSASASGIRFSVSRNAKQVEKDTPYKKFFWNFSKNY